MLPNFICVGTGRAGTSWLYEVLLAHPEVCTARNIKETQFFNEHYDKGLGWYEKFFEDCSGAKARGEISNRYIFDPRVAARIKEAVPDCKIIVCLRNPYERIQSVYTFKLREGALNCSFEEALEGSPELITENRYFTLLKPYYELFGRENIFTLFYDRLVGDPEGLCRDLFRFLGVDETFVPSVLNQKVNAAVVPRLPVIAHLTKGTARVMRKLHLYGPLTRAKRSDLIKSILFKDYNYGKEDLLTEKARRLIDPVVLPELERLEGLVGKDLDAWRKRAGARL